MDNFWNVESCGVCDSAPHTPTNFNILPKSNQSFTLNLFINPTTIRLIPLRNSSSTKRIISAIFTISTITNFIINSGSWASKLIITKVQ